MKRVLILYFLCICGFVNASSLYSPYPNVINTNIEVSTIKVILNKNYVDLNYYLSGSINSSAYPLIVIPCLKVDSGIILTLSPNNSNLTSNVSTGIGVLVNLFIYDNNLYDLDLIVLNNNCLSLGYRIKLIDNLIIEPFVGGNIDFFTSTQHFVGIVPWVSLNVGIKFIL